MFDVAVNKGVGRSIRFLQRALGVAADGAFGPKTLAAVEACDVTRVLAEFQARNMHHYGSLGTFDTFGLGWSRRLVSTTIAACSRADATPVAKPRLPAAFAEDAPAPPIPDEFPDEPVPEGSTLFGPLARKVINLAFTWLPRLYPESKALALLVRLRGALQKGT